MNKLCVPTPDGVIMVEKTSSFEEYPGVSVSLLHADGQTTDLALVEYTPGGEMVTAEVPAARCNGGRVSPGLATRVWPDGHATETFRSVFHVNYDAEEMKKPAPQPEEDSRPALHGPWEEYADEHILCVRAFDSAISPTMWEYVKAISDVHDEDHVLFSHGMVFTQDYMDLDDEAVEALSRILQDFGYADLDDFVEQTGDGQSLQWVYDEEGKRDRMATPNYIIDWPLLVSLIAEHSDDGVSMSDTHALRKVKQITGIDYV